MAKLTAEQLKALPDDQFGLPETRQYPMPDEVHVTKAIQFFRYCKEDKRSTLAKNINRRAKALGMKVKVQPSSPFYKYCSRDIMKEGTLVTEFHIGQLAPIVPLQPEVIKPNFNTDKNTPMERLKKVWDSKKSLEEKNLQTFNITQTALMNEAKFDINMETTYRGIYDANYMLNSAKDFQNLEFRGALGMMDNLKTRIFNSDFEMYNKIFEFTEAGDVENIIKALMAIKNLGILSAAIAHVNYSMSLNETQKREINNAFRTKILVNGLPHINNFEPDQYQTFSNIAISKVKGLTDEDIAKIDTFKRLVNSELMYQKTKRVAKMIFDERVSRGMKEFDNLIPVPLYHMITYLMNISDDEKNVGYYIDDEFNDLFIRLVNGLYYGIPYYVEHSKDSKEFDILLIKIYDAENPEYNDGIVNHFSIQHSKFAVSVNELKINSPAVKALEASDFADVYKGIQISSNGNISFLMGIDNTWQEKLQLCKKEMEKNEKEESWENYKCNLCFLFALINHIHKNYDNSESESKDVKEAIKTMNSAIELFRSAIKKFSKIDKNFNFVQYYLDNQINSKICVFNVPEHDLASEVNVAYRFIIAG